MRRWFRDWTPIIGVVLFVVALAWSIWQIFVLPPDQRGDAIGLGQFVLAAVGLAATAIGAVWKSRARDLPRSPDEVVDLLVGAVKAQWTRAAGERRLLEPAPIPIRWRRATLAITGPVLAAVGSGRVAPLPGLGSVSEAELRVGGRSELHAIYGGLGSGRLVIVGAPGSGKSGAAILLLLDALQHRERVTAADRRRVPVPVLFTLHGWDPTTQRLETWLASRLVETYSPIFTGRQAVAEATTLLTGEHLSVILDGLDEIAEALRPAVLRALSEQAGFRVVLLTRSQEMVAAASHARLDGAVALELQDIDGSTAADYLTRVQLDPPPASWQRLTSHLRDCPTSAVSQALNRPLMLTLVRDTYTAADDVAELLDSAQFASQQAVEDYLLDRVLPAAYARPPGTFQPQYTLDQAERALRYIAQRMNQDGTRELAWWLLPRWTAAAPRIILTGLVVGSVVGLAFGLVAGLVARLAFGLVAGLVVGLVAGLMVGLAYGRGGHAPERVAPLRWGSLMGREAIQLGLVVGLAVGLMVGLLVGLMVGLGVGAGVGAGLMVGLMVGLMALLSRPGVDDVTPSDPLESWRRDRTYGLVIGSAVGLAFALVVGLVAGLMVGLVAGLAFGLVVGLAFGLMICLSHPKAWPTALACLQLRIAHGTPLRMIRFLEDARARNVLRTVGPLYQFRHARLQDRLAGTAPILESRRT
jgi:hypothetical protein